MMSSNIRGRFSVYSLTGVSCANRILNPFPICSFDVAMHDLCGGKCSVSSDWIRRYQIIYLTYLIFVLINDGKSQSSHFGYVLFGLLRGSFGNKEILEPLAKNMSPLIVCGTRFCIG